MLKYGNGSKIVTFSDNMPSEVCLEFKRLLDATIFCLKGVGTLVLIGLIRFWDYHQYSDYLCLLVKGCDCVNRSLIGLMSNAF